jgi:hypothetical protein
MYPCRVCGYLTFAEPPGSYDICAVGGWESYALQLEFATSVAGGANSVTLATAAAIRGQILRHAMSRQFLSSYSWAGCIMQDLTPICPRWILATATWPPTRVGCLTRAPAAKGITVCALRAQIIGCPCS